MVKVATPGHKPQSRAGQSELELAWDLKGMLCYQTEEAGVQFRRDVGNRGSIN